MRDILVSAVLDSASPLLVTSLEVELDALVLAKESSGGGRGRSGSDGGSRRRHFGCCVVMLCGDVVWYVIGVG